MNPGKHQRSKQRGQDGGWKVHRRAHLLCTIHELRNGNVFLVSGINTRNLLLYFVRFCALSTPKIANKKPTTKNFAGFHNHFPLLAMVQRSLNNEILKEKGANHEILDKQRECLLWLALVLPPFQFYTSVEPINKPESNQALFRPFFFMKICMGGT